MIVGPDQVDLTALLTEVRTYAATHRRDIHRLLAGMTDEEGAEIIWGARTRRGAIQKMAAHCWPVNLLALAQVGVETLPATADQMIRELSVAGLL